MAVEYKVLRIDEMTRIGEAGGIEKFYRHQIKTKGGVVFTVDITEKDWIAETVAPILLKKATEADKIKAL